MSNIMDKISQMLKNNEIPDEVKNMMNNFSNSASNEASTSSKSSSSHCYNETDTSNKGSSSDFNLDNSRNSDSSNDSSFDFDIGTMLKMKSVIDAMNSQKDDPRANLLKSLKPYLKPSRKEKVDQYVKLFSMGKMFEVLGPLGGEKKNDV